VFALWIDLVKAHRGEHLGGKYVLRWWKNDRWNYKYSDLRHPKNHGWAASAVSDEHSVTTHSDSVARGHTAEQAFHHAREKALKSGADDVSIIRSAEGKPELKLVVRPSAKRPFIILPHRSTKARDAVTHLPSYEAVENWMRRRSSTATVNDAFGRPWFEVRERGQSGIDSPSGRMSIRYHAESPFNRFPEQTGSWVPSPFFKQNFKEWLKEEYRQQRASGQRVKPAKEFPIDQVRPTTTALEQGRLTWHRVLEPYQATVKRQTGQPWQRRGLRWVRKLKASEAEQLKLCANIIREHFGLAVLSAQRQLTLYNVFDPGNMARLLGYYGGPGRAKKIEIDPDSPTLRAVKRAVNSYDPQKGWRFSTYLGHCLWWEHFKETKAILDEVKERRKFISTVDHSGRTMDVLDQVSREELPPGHEEIVSEGAHAQSAEDDLIAREESLQEWSGRQEDRLAKYVASDTADHERQVTSFLALHELKEIKSPEQAQAFIVHWQSEGGDEFVEPFEREVEEPKVQKLSGSEKHSWVTMVKQHPLLTAAERAAILTLAPKGDLQNIRPFTEVTAELATKHTREFPRPPTESQLVDLFLSAHQKLSGLPEFQAMQAKLSPVAKAIQLLQSLSMNRLSKALDILRKAQKGTRSQHYKYWRREGVPGSYRYYYRDHVGNVIQGTNAPVGHAHYDKKLGTPQLHRDEPDPIQHPQFFDPRSGRKMNRAVPEHAEWNPEYNKAVPLRMWGARWRADPNDETSHFEHGYYDSDLRERDELKFNQDNRHFDQQLPKVRKFYSSLMQSKQLAHRALGLMVALLDQAYMRAGRKIHEEERGTIGLTTLKVGNVKIKGNMATFSYVGKLGVDQQQVVVLDPKSMSILQELTLAEGKKRTDYLFSVPVRRGSQVKFQEIGYNKLRRTLATLGVTPKQFRTYHGTEIFSRAFERLLQQYSQGRITAKTLSGVTEEAALESAKALGHYIGKGEDRKAHAATALRSYIDPVAVKSLWMNAIDPDMQKAHPLMGRIKYEGMNIAIENKKGSYREWYDPNAKEHGRTKMNYDYGYVSGSKGVDGDAVDVYMGPHKNSERVFVIHQMKKPDFTEFDEDKVMLGFDSPEEAKAAYLRQYDNPKFFGSLTEMSLDDFKQKIKDKGLRGKMLKSIDEPEPGDDDEVPAHSVVADPPDRFDHEVGFSEWLHSHPLHESEHEWQYLNQMAGGKLDLPNPETDHEEPDDVDAEDELDSTDRSGPADESTPQSAWEEPAGDSEEQEAAANGGAPSEGEAVQPPGEGPLREDQSQVRSPSPT